MNARAVPIGAAVAAVLALAPPAAAHVTLNPNEWEAGGFARFAVRVPNERDGAATTRITMRFPEEVLDASFQPVEGWRREVRMVRLDQPREIEGERVTERIGTVTWSGGRIETGEFQEFGVSFQTPEEPGAELAFPALQRYSDGEVVRWIGPPDAEQPAPTVTITEAAAEEEPATAPAATPEPGAGEDESDETLSIIALIAGVCGLAAGLAALLLRRPRTTAR